MAKVTCIEATLPEMTQRKKVAAYARVSDDTELHSFSAQVSHYSKLIQSNPEWQYAGVYADAGITGTRVAPREEFKRMLQDAEDGKIDLVLTKSISRFARDTVDCLKTIRHLKEIGVEVRFERENISTFSADGEVLLTLLASFAQAESDSISANVKWATRKKFEKGIPNGHIAPYGYRWDADADMFVIVPEQGEIVKQIYREYLAGQSAYSIAKELREKGVTGNTGKPLDAGTIKKILTSDSYAGTMILQKFYNSDTHVKKINNGELQRYAVDGMFEPLVSAEDLERARTIRRARAEAIPGKEITRFSGIIRCGICGGSISRRTDLNRKIWKCNNKETKDSCDMRNIWETELYAASEKTLGKISDEDFRKQVSRVQVYGDRVEFHLKTGRVKSVPRMYEGTRGRNAFTNKVYCGNCGGKCKRITNYYNGKTSKEWKCTSCGVMIREPDLIAACEDILGRNYTGRIVTEIDKISITKDSVFFENGEIQQWKRK